MRLLLVLAALPGLTAAAPAPVARMPVARTPVARVPLAGRNWTMVAARTPQGSYVIGNPRAPVKLVEYASYTCPHCAAFSVESEPVLGAQMIRSGSTSLEIRHVLFNALDLGVAVLARCTGPRRFAATTAFIFRTQPDWLGRGQAYLQANAGELGRMGPLPRLRALVDGSGLTAAIVARGLPLAAVAACFADQAEVDRLTAAMNDIPAGVTGTPAFVLNGRLITRTGWSQLEPALRDAGAH